MGIAPCMLQNNPERRVHAKHETRTYVCSHCFKRIEVTLTPEERIRDGQSET